MPSDDDNAYDLVVEDRPHLLYVRVRGENMSVDTLRDDLLPKILKEISARNSTRVLYEYDFPRRFEPSESGGLMEELVSSLPRDVRVAFLTNYYHLDALETAALITGSAGQDFHFFTNAEAAEGWLLGPNK